MYYNKVMDNNEHLILYGLPGTGKTWYTNNKSSDTIYIVPDIIRNSIELRKLFIELSQTKLHKSCVIDFADNIPRLSQYIIVDAMDELSFMQFIFICNQPKYFIETLKKRCIMKLFSCINIVDFIPNCPDNIIKYADGDLRIAMIYNNIPAYYIHNKITPDHWIIINTLIKNCSKRNLFKTYNSLLKICIDNGYNISQIRNENNGTNFIDTEMWSLRLELSKFLCELV